MAIFIWHDGTVPRGMEVRQVYGLIFSSDGRLLLLAEKKGETIKYSLGGGHPEQDDAGLEATLRREIWEELNITIMPPIIVGYQEVNEGNGMPLFAQVRMTALIDSVGEIRPDVANGKTYGRLLVSPMKAIDLLKWGKVGESQVKAAMRIAKKELGISEFAETDDETYI